MIMSVSRTGAELLGNKPLLRPVVGLAEKLPRADLEQITIDAIRKHRRLRDRAEALHAEGLAPPSVGQRTDVVGSAKLAYVQAMIEVHGQQAVLSTLLDVLGYTPKVPKD